VSVAVGARLGLDADGSYCFSLSLSLSLPLSLSLSLCLSLSHTHTHIHTPGGDRGSENSRGSTARSRRGRESLLLSLSPPLPPSPSLFLFLSLALSHTHLAVPGALRVAVGARLGLDANGRQCVCARARGQEEACDCRVALEAGLVEGCVGVPRLDERVGESTSFETVGEGICCPLKPLVTWAWTSARRPIMMRTHSVCPLYACLALGVVSHKTFLVFPFLNLSFSWNKGGPVPRGGGAGGARGRSACGGERPPPAGRGQFLMGEVPL